MVYYDEEHFELPGVSYSQQTTTDAQNQEMRATISTLIQNVQAQSSQQQFDAVRQEQMQEMEETVTATNAIISDPIKPPPAAVSPPVVDSPPIIQEMTAAPEPEPEPEPEETPLLPPPEEPTSTISTVLVLGILLLLGAVAATVYWYTKK